MARATSDIAERKKNGRMESTWLLCTTSKATVAYRLYELYTMYCNTMYCTLCTVHMASHGLQRLRVKRPNTICART